MTSRPLSVTAINKERRSLGQVNVIVLSFQTIEHSGDGTTITPNDLHISEGRLILKMHFEQGFSLCCGDVFFGKMLINKAIFEQISIANRNSHFQPDSDFHGGMILL